MKRVLMTLYGPLENDTRVLRSIEAFIDKGYIVTIITCMTDLQYFCREGVSVIETKIPLNNKISYIKFIYYLLKFYLKNGRQYDIIYMHDFYATMPGTILSYFTDIPIYYDAHELLLKRKEDDISFRDKFFIFWEKKFIKRVKYIIEANKEREIIMRRFYNIKNTINVMNITNYSNKNHFERVINKDDIFLVYQGFMSENRFISFYIKAIEKISKNVKLVLIGDGPDLDKYKLLTNELGVDDRIIFTGRLSNIEMMERLKKCHIGIISYSFSSLNNIYCSPNKMFEYASISLPFIATPQPFIQKISDKYKIGMTYKLNDINSFVDNLNIIINNYQDYQKWMDLFLKDFNYKREIEKLMAII